MRPTEDAPHPPKVTRYAPPWGDLSLFFRYAARVFNGCSIVLLRCFVDFATVFPCWTHCDSMLIALYSRQRIIFENLGQNISVSGVITGEPSAHYP
jgi:hypothetical protein